MVNWLRAWTVGALFVAWLVSELLAAFIPALHMRTLTKTVVTYLPWPVTQFIVGALVAWLPGHFISNYARKETTLTSLDPNQPQPSEPLLSVGTIVAVVTAVLDALGAWGLNLGDAKQAALLGLVNVAAPIVVAVWGRRKVFSPATVARILRVKAAAPAAQPPATPPAA